MTVQLRLRNETPGALRYEELKPGTAVVNDDSHSYTIGTLCLRKHAFPLGAPKVLNLTIEVAGE